MRNVSIVLVALIVLHGPITVGAQADAASRLMKARSLKCEFGAGSHAEWKNGALVVGSGRFGPPAAASTIHYDAINLSARKAKVIGTSGSSDLDVVPSRIGVTLIEQVPGGGVAMTTVYSSYDAKRAFPAVMSKHVDVAGPFPQQYYGSCVIWE